MLVTTHGASGLAASATLEPSLQAFGGVIVTSKTEIDALSLQDLFGLILCTIFGSIKGGRK